MLPIASRRAMPLGNAELRAVVKGLRPIQIWVPGVRASEFVAEATRTLALS